MLGIFLYLQLIQNLKDMQTLKQVLESMPKLYSTENQKVKDVKITFVIPGTRWLWHIVEARQEGENDFLLFGYCHSGLGDDCSEWGYVMFSQLVEVCALPVVQKNLKIDMNGRAL